MISKKGDKSTYIEHLKHSAWNNLLLPLLPVMDTRSSSTGNPHPLHVSTDLSPGSDFNEELRNIADFLRDLGESLSIIFFLLILGDTLLYRCIIGGFSEQEKFEADFDMRICAGVSSLSKAILSMFVICTGDVTGLGCFWTYCLLSTSGEV